MKRTVLGFVLSFAVASTVVAQTPPDWTRRPSGASQPGPTPPPGQPDPIGALLFPPELVMAHQNELGLSDAQRATILKEVVSSQTKFVDMQWKMSAEMEKLTMLLSAAPIDEAQTLEQLDRILTAERDVKKAQIGLLVRIKNTLTRDQQAKLERVRQPNGPQGPEVVKRPPEPDRP